MINIVLFLYEVLIDIDFNPCAVLDPVHGSSDFFFFFFFLLWRKVSVDPCPIFKWLSRDRTLSIEQFLFRIGGYIYLLSIYVCVH